MSSLIGKKFNSRNYGEFEVVGYEHPYYELIFLSTGYRSKAQYKEVTKGKVKDWYKPHVLGVGFMGKGKYKATFINSEGKKQNTKAYETWRGILRRCYDKKNNNYARYGGRGVKVCEEWLNFQTFAEWFNNSYNYLTQIYTEGSVALDKDLSLLGNKVYAPDVCELIPYEINSLFCGGVQSGVYFKKDSNKYRVQLHKWSGRQVCIGDYLDIREARSVYRKEKQKWVNEVGEVFKDILPSAIYHNLVTGKALDYYLETETKEVYNRGD